MHTGRDRELLPLTAASSLPPADPAPNSGRVRPLSAGPCGRQALGATGRRAAPAPEPRSLPAVTALPPRGRLDRTPGANCLSRRTQRRDQTSPDSPLRRGEDEPTDDPAAARYRADRPQSPPSIRADRTRALGNLARSKDSKACRRQQPEHALREGVSATAQTTP